MPELMLQLVGGGAELEPVAIDRGDRHHLADRRGEEYLVRIEEPREREHAFDRRVVLRPPPR